MIRTVEHSIWRIVIPLVMAGFCTGQGTPNPYPDCLAINTLTAIPPEGYGDNPDGFPVASAHSSCRAYCRDTGNMAYYGVVRNGPYANKARCYCDYRLDDVANTGMCNYTCGGQPCGGTGNTGIWISVFTICLLGIHGRNCALSCPGYCYYGVCNLLTGVCDNGCQEGWFGAQCDRLCPVNCEGGCYQSDGGCAACKPGFYGYFCEMQANPETHPKCLLASTSDVIPDLDFPLHDAHEQCENNCRINHNASYYAVKRNGPYGSKARCYCDYRLDDVANTGMCNYTCGGQPCGGTGNTAIWMSVFTTCRSGLYGRNCSMSCPGYCYYGVCDVLTGHCDNGCQEGWYASNCTQRCANCVNGCNQSDGVCEAGGCSPGWYGDLCNHPGNCSDTGYWGENCNQTCCNCVTGCQQTDGVCYPGGCVVGWYVDMCTSLCPGHCKYDTCDQASGACPGDCDNGYYMLFCNVTCPVNCLQKCQKSDGHCIYGCDDGYYGAVCDESCSQGCGDVYCHNVTGDCFSCHGNMFGVKCDQLCPINCTDDVCAFSGGDCHRGCKLGSHGMKCNEMCPVGCVNGECDQIEGTCTQGCVDGITGDICGETVSSPNLAIIIGCVMGGIILVVGIIMAVVFGRRKKTKKDNKSPASVQESDIQSEMPNTSEHQSRVHSYVNVGEDASHLPECQSSTVIHVTDFLKFLQMKDLAKHPFREEYQVLEQLRTEMTQADQAVLSRRVSLPLEEPVNYINAVRVESLSEKDAYFVTELPLPDTVSRFWTMVTHYNSTAIIMILQQRHLMEHTRFLPPAYRPILYENLRNASLRGETQYRSVDIDKESVIETGIKQDGSCYSQLNILQELSVDNLKQEDGYTKLTRQNEQQQKDVMRLFEVVLPDGVQCLDISTVLSVYQDVEKWQQQQRGRPPVVVTCLDGAKYSGQFVACSNLFKMISQNQQVDVFSVAKAVRESRPQFIGTYEEYENLYRAAGHYISQHTTYMEINA